MPKSKEAPKELAEVKRNLEQVERSQKALSDIEGNLKKYLGATMKMMGCLDSTGKCIQDATAAMTVHLEERRQSAFCREQCMPVDTLHQVARLLASAIRDLQDGSALAMYKETLHKHIFSHMGRLRKSAKESLGAGRAALSLLKKQQDKDAVVARKEKKYAKMNKSLTESKRYEKQVKDRDKARSAAEAQVRKFNNLYSSHMESVEALEGDFMDSFIDANALLLQQASGAFITVGEDALRAYPQLAAVLVRTSGRAAPRAVNGGSPPTRSSRLKMEEDSAGAWANGDAAERPNLETEPLAEDPAPGNQYLLNYAEAESRASTVNDAHEQPLTNHKPPEAREAPHAPDHFDAAVSDAHEQPFTQLQPSAPHEALHAPDHFDAAVNDAHEQPL
ncbi:uncharacterized protein Tco025E_07476, partial [Trypanosoma conorhini]